MKEYVCYVCGRTFKRAQSQVRKPDEVCCSLDCRNLKFKKSLIGKNNPNYRHGRHVGPSLCKCGREKDYRSALCAICSSRGVSKTGETNFDRQAVIDAIVVSNSFLEAARISGMPRHGVARVVRENGIDVSHMMSGRGRKRTETQIFCQKTGRDGTTRKYLRELYPELYFCSACGQEPHWNGMPLVLQMDHINGDGHNDTRDNLRWLCPNCHTQTETFNGRNAKKRRNGGSIPSDADVVS